MTSEARVGCEISDDILLVNLLYPPRLAIDFPPGGFPPPAVPPILAQADPFVPPAAFFPIEALGRKFPRTMQLER